MEQAGESFPREITDRAEGEEVKGREAALAAAPVTKDRILVVKSPTESSAFPLAVPMFSAVAGSIACAL
jgi:hypothetical protein